MNYKVGHFEYNPSYTTSTITICGDRTKLTLEEIKDTEEINREKIDYHKEKLDQATLRLQNILEDKEEILKVEEKFWKFKVTLTREEVENNNSTEELICEKLNQAHSLKNKFITKRETPKSKQTVPTTYYVIEL